MGYLSTIKENLFIVSLVTLLLLAITELWHYVKHERISVFHRFLIVLFGIYLTILFSLTVVPVWNWKFSFIGQNINLLPLQVLTTMAGNPLNLYGNILMFIPFGFLFVLLTKHIKFYVVTLSGALLSLLIEILQLFSFRATDIDDVILNTLGTFIGFLLGSFLLACIPFLRRATGVYVRKKGVKKIQLVRNSGHILCLTFTSLFILLFIKTGDTFAASETERSPRSFASETEDLRLSTPETEDHHLSTPETEDLHLSTPSTYEFVPLREAEESLTIAADLWAANVCLINTATSEVLYEKNSDDQIAPASTAKMLSALTALDYCSIDETVTVGREVQYIAADSSRAWLYAGNKLTLRQLLTAMLLPSGNDAAYTLAVHTGRVIAGDSSLSIEQAISVFLEAMNEKAISVGADSSNFLTPDGYDTAAQYTTARDLACIAQACINQAELYEIMGSYSISAVWESGQAVTYENTNELLNPDSEYYYPFITGMKTGKTSTAGSCLVSSACFQDEIFICVVMGSTESGRYTDSLILYETLEAEFLQEY